MTMLLLALLFLVGVPQEAAAPASANVWQGKTAEFEEQLRTVNVVKVEELKIGVTHPQRAWTAPGSPIESFAWKRLPPGRVGGYWESYKSEIAAYELDKVLELNMVPVSVERKVKGEIGAAIFWLTGTRSWEAVQPLPKPASWNKSLAKMKMFDCLIGNNDRNKGNMLIDAAWNLYLIDHSRAFVDDKKLPQQIQTVDEELWKHMESLDEATLKDKLGKWVERGSIKAILERRDAMKKIVDANVAKMGPAAFVK